MRCLNVATALGATAILTRITVQLQSEWVFAIHQNLQQNGDLRFLPFLSFLSCAKIFCPFPPEGEVFWLYEQEKLFHRKRKIAGAAVFGFFLLGRRQPTPQEWVCSSISTSIKAPIGLYRGHYKKGLFPGC